MIWYESKKITKKIQYYLCEDVSLLYDVIFMFSNEKD